MKNHESFTLITYFEGKMLIDYSAMKEYRCLITDTEISHIRELEPRSVCVIKKHNGLKVDMVYESRMGDLVRRGVLVGARWDKKKQVHRIKHREELKQKIYELLENEV